MKIYLDNCCIQRPLDDKNQFRIAIESEIVLNILSLIESEKIRLISSDMLVFEANKNTNIFRREFTLDILGKANDFVNLSKNIEIRAKDFILEGIKPIDALHLASAEEIKADYFCTCDDKFLKKAKKIKNLEIRVNSLFEIIKEIEK
ncbi:MAG: PIN domain-containing protein [Bacteroidales bacterium]|nr:PIN domain-containing protein [Bacteroidales bacterium]